MLSVNPFDRLEPSLKPTTSANVERRPRADICQRLREALQRPMCMMSVSPHLNSPAND